MDAVHIHPRSTMRDSQSSVESKYIVNVNKAQSKKLEATQRKQNIEYILKEGGIVMTADAVTFELLKLATIKNLSTKGPITYKDKSRTATVQYTIKVKRQEANYSINIYTTTSRLMINGPSANYFVSNDIITIRRIITDSLREEGIKILNIDQLNRSWSSIITITKQR